MTSHPLGLDEIVPKGFRHGTHRLVDPETTLARVQPHMAAMGITRIANVTGLDYIGIPVAVACRPNSRGLAVSQGKGLDLAAARASALMECVEGHHAERIELPLLYGRLADLRDRRLVVDPLTLVRIDRPFDAEAALLWAEGYDLCCNEPILVPYELVHTDFTVPGPPGSRFFNAGSNGLASGNHRLEAISHALCEVVERDATHRWRGLDAAARQQTRVELGSIDDPCCVEVLDRYQLARVDVGVWESTGDTAIPSFVCVIANPAAGSVDSMSAIGAGCHPARAVALLRALTEAAQVRLTVIVGSREDIARDAYHVSQSPDRAQLDSELLWAEAPARRFGDAPNFSGETFNDDLTWEIERLRAVGADRVIALDLTRAEFEIPVVRVIIPKMRL